jgi:Helicase HerA, central domain
VDGIEGLGVFYVGRPYDLATQTSQDVPLLYDSKDLVTHAVCVGMTGSGKTGLCLAMIEEAVLDGIPAVIVDPKGDLANLLLTFPQLRPEDFRPWIDEAEAQQAGVTPDEFAAQTAARWATGLADWGQDGARIGRLKDAADFAIYTPGSDAGLPVSVLGSLAPPPGRPDAETMRDSVATTVSGILGLLGIDADPIKSREHILISTILATSWQAGRALDLPGLIAQIQSPPVHTIGVLDVETFFKADDRFALAMQINNLLAAPGFDLWMKGEPLDAQRLLVTPEGRPRVSIFSIAHLSDAERMFFVTLLSNAMVAWMRAQSGTSSLRAIYYLDEIFGFFPPVAEPPSKRPLLTLLKQARAAGLGVVLATQNPADLDYKGLSNAGTWLIGRLQADRDKQRLLDGLEGAAASGPFDRAQMEQTIAGLGKRVFLMNNVHESAPVVFESRFALSYLRGPLTRDQIRTLMAGRTPAAAAPATAATPVAAPTGAAPVPPAAPAAPSAPPAIPPDVPRYYIPRRGSTRAGASLHYVPMVIGSAAVRVGSATSEVTLLAPLSDGAVTLTWDSAVDAGVTAGDLGAAAEGDASYGDVPAAARTKRVYGTWSADLGDWLYRTQEVTVYKSARFKETSLPGESEGDFRNRLSVAAREQRDAAVEKLRARFATKHATLAERVRKAEQAVSREAEQARGAKVQTAISLGSSILGAILGRRKSLAGATSVLRGVGRSVDQAGDTTRAKETVTALEAQDAELQSAFDAATQEVDRSFDPVTEPLETVAVRPKKADIDVRLVALAFAPHWLDANGVLTAAWR